MNDKMGLRVLPNNFFEVVLVSIFFASFRDGIGLHHRLFTHQIGRPSDVSPRVVFPKRVAVRSGVVESSSPDPFPTSTVRLRPSIFLSVLGSIHPRIHPSSQAVLPFVLSASAAARVQPSTARSRTPRATNLLTHRIKSIPYCGLLLSGSLILTSSQLSAR